MRFICVQTELLNTVISIRAPVWGAICSSKSQNAQISHFNPRTRVGCDLFHLSSYCPRLTISIRAPVWGAMFLFRHLSRYLQHFNPRTRVGCDSVEGSCVLAITVFQSAHPCGVRSKFFFNAIIFFSISIRAPVWGAMLTCWTHSVFA